jgi:beta-lactamase class A
MLNKENAGVRTAARKWALVVLWAVIAKASAQTSLDARVRKEVESFRGSVSLYAKNLQTGAIYDLHGGEPVRTASTIKLPIMIECFHLQAAGQLDWKQSVTITEEAKVSGSGIVQDFVSGTKLPIRDLLQVMIVLSDNTATNLILDRITGNAVNARMEQLGLKQTRVMRKILGDRSDLKPQPSGITKEGSKPENAKWGLGRSSPQEMVSLLEKLYRGSLVSRSASDEMLNILRAQRDHNGIGRDLKDVVIASKSGALDHLRSDVGIVYAKNGPIAIAITVDKIPDIDWTPDNPAYLLMSRVSELLMDGLSAK